jgi:Ser/Thr protein kinase RdoA (MazF antagonist)
MSDESSIAAVTPGDQAILDALAAGGKIDVTGATLARRHYAYSTSFAIEELTITSRRGDVHKAIFKDLSPSALIGCARVHRPQFMYDREREILVYRHLLSDSGLDAAELLGSVNDPDSQRYWLFLEYIGGGQLRHVGDLTAWEEAARWIARLHAYFHPRTRSVPQVPLLNYDRSFFLGFFNRFESSAARNPDVATACRALRPAITRAATLLNESPSTLIHGEYYPANVLIRSGNADDRPWAVCPIDWEVAGVGSAVLDLAALVAGNWPEEARLRMIRAYLEQSNQLGLQVPALQSMLQLIEAARLLTAIQWLGWADGWTPPPDQARDWLRDALEAGRRLT